jgi:hypothetical protein
LLTAFIVFNAILVIVSHLVNPSYRNDKAALAQLDKAMGMINRMSKSHAVAKRAYVFLQQLLSYMDKSLCLVDTNFRVVEEPQGSVISSQIYQQPYPEEVTPMFWDQHAAESQYNMDFFTLLDVTHDLAENLGTQLETHGGTGSTLWSWAEE